MAGTASGTCAASPWDAGRVRDKRRVLWPTAAVAFVLSLPAGSSRGTARVQAGNPRQLPWEPSPLHSPHLSPCLAGLRGELSQPCVCVHA